MVFLKESPSFLLRRILSTSGRQDQDEDFPPPQAWSSLSGKMWAIPISNLQDPSKPGPARLWHQVPTGHSRKPGNRHPHPLRSKPMRVGRGSNEKSQNSEKAGPRSSVSDSSWFWGNLQASSISPFPIRRPYSLFLKACRH